MEDFIEELRLDFPNVVVVNDHWLTFQQPVTFEQRVVIEKIASRHLIDAYQENDVKYFLSYNACIECGVMLGSCNPRQFCRKFYCSKSSMSC
jgi:heterodisulfide reductase subunit C